MLKIILASLALATASASSASISVNFQQGYGPLTQSGNGAIVAGNSSGNYAKPFGATGRYYVTYAGSSSLSLNTSGIFTRVSFLHGSVDSYNSLQILGLNGNVLKTVNYVGNGYQGASNTFYRSYYVAKPIRSVKFISGSNSFEIDDLKFSNSIPEPETWAMLVVGFGFIGYAARKTKYKVTA